MLEVRGPKAWAALDRAQRFGADGTVECVGALWDAVARDQEPPEDSDGDDLNDLLLGKR